MAPKRAKPTYAEGDTDSETDAPIKKSKAKRAVVLSDDEEFEAPELEAEAESSADEDEDLEAEMNDEDEGEARGSEEEPEGDIVMSEEEENKPKKAAPRKKSTVTKSGVKREKGLNENDKPMFKLPDIFADLASRAETGLLQAAKHLDGRALRVGTMCSGTESPLLALDLLTNALERNTGEKLKVEHVFSCEIEPFKQAYIERNFAPALLFRDVTTLGDDEAQTAYGGLKKVPGGLDLLVAGTSCVDYSALNKKKKQINAGGESGATFFGMLDYVKKHTPSIVILENVQGAPWDQCIEFFKQVGYFAKDMSLDTKNYYIPHTRTRGYMIAVPKDRSSVPDKWISKMHDLSRQASVPLERFLLPADDPRITRVRSDLATSRLLRDGSERTKSDWQKCESRHHRARDEERLGDKRPLTAWQATGGPPTVMDGAWAEWAVAQTERVLDLMDINALRMALLNVDVRFKTASWNLSQNVDRSTVSPTLGISPCLTPNMIPYLTNRGGPIIGAECLHLQGLPIDQLILTRESTDQLADLAGNAMSSTVVGSAIVAALCVAGETLGSQEDGDDNDEVTTAPIAKVVNVEDRIRGSARLTDHSVDFAKLDPLNSKLFELAAQSARKCLCEGRASIAKRAISVCESCGHSACEDCKSRPEHQYVLDTSRRIQPNDFEWELKDALPMSFSLIGMDLASLQAQVEAERQADVPVHVKLIDSYIARVADAVDGSKFYFRTVTRRKNWVAMYSSEHATMELIIEPTGMQWRLTVDADEECAVNDPLRLALGSPLARLRIAPDAKDLFDGKWDLRLPITKQNIDVTIDPIGESVPSWRSTMGLTDFQNEKRPSQVRVTASSPLLDQSLDGVYELKSSCGTACNSLHRRIEPVTETPLYLFFDPARSTENKDDSWVFAPECDTVDYGTSRPVVGTLPKGWFLGDDGTQTVNLAVSSKWAPLAAAHFFRPEEQELSSISHPSSALDLSADLDACSYAESVLSARVKLSPLQQAPKWMKSEWHEVDLSHEGPEMLQHVAFVFPRTPKDLSLDTWTPFTQHESDIRCDSCCPPPPIMRFKRTKARAVVAVEDGIDAGRFEQALKARPSPILFHTRQLGDYLEFRIGLNVATLAHKASSALPDHGHRKVETAGTNVSWRMSSAAAVDLTLGRPGVPRVFSLSSNRLDKQHPQPKRLATHLRPEQLRSLTWMLGQENDPKVWVESEVVEASVAQLGWHIEAKATREASVRGGVLADQVGYGKTAITIGLICEQKAKATLPVDLERIPTKATLIFVPPQLTTQWPKEIEKFAGKNKLKVITIKTMVHFNSTSIQDIVDADIVLVSNTIFGSPLYWARMGDFSASRNGIAFDANAGRYFRHCVDEAVAALPEQLRVLRDEGASAASRSIEAARKVRKPKEALDIDAPRRLKGQAFVAQQKLLEKVKAGELDKKYVLTIRQAEEALDGKAPKAEKPKQPMGTIGNEDDPWKLKSSEVRKDYTKTMCPSFAMFAFARIVIDEFTYADPAQMEGFRSIRANNRWILSGTPGIKNFGEIKHIAELLNIHLGVDDEFAKAKLGKGEKAAKGQHKTTMTENTSAEEFHSFREVHTIGWHRARDDIAQKFLDDYVRQNVAEIGEIPYVELLVQTQLPAAEMAIYREAEHHLTNIDPTFRKIAKVKADKQNDRIARLAEGLGQSDSPEEALLKRCSHFSLDMPDEYADLKDAPSVCDQILATRVGQADDCEKELLKTLLVGAKLYRELYKGGFFYERFNRSGKLVDEKHLPEWLRDVFSDDKVGDVEARDKLRQVCQKANCSPDKVGEPTADLADGIEYPEAWNEAKKPASDKDSGKREEFRKARVWVYREVMHQLRRLLREFVGRVRSTRYFGAVRKIQLGRPEDAENVGILSICGHEGPLDEVRARAKEQTCVEKFCRAPIRSPHVVDASSLGHEEVCGTFGAKLEKIVDAVDSLPKKDRILVFVQFEDLYIKVYQALKSYGIGTAVLEGTAVQMSKTLDDYQSGTSTERVLLLHLTNSSASGANLTIANHAIFISPLLTPSLERYISYETQAIGRVRRYGQEKDVKVYRMLAFDTIDKDIFEERAGTQIKLRLQEQEKEHSGATNFPRTTRKMVRFTGVPKGSGRGKKGAKPEGKAKGKGKSKKANSSDEEDEAVSSEQDAPPKKRAAKPRALKGKTQTIILDDDDSERSDDEHVPKPKKSASSKAKAIEDSSEEEEEDADEKPQTAQKATSTAPVKKPSKIAIVAKSKAVSAAPPKAGRVVSGVKGTIPSMFAKASSAAKRSAEGPSVTSGPSSKKQKVAIEVVPLSPKKRAELQAAEDAAKSAPNSPALEGTPSLADDVVMEVEDESDLFEM